MLIQRTNSINNNKKSKFLKERKAKRMLSSLGNNNCIQKIAFSEYIVFTETIKFVSIIRF